MNIKELYKLYSANFLVDTDTRKIRKGTIFFALKGANFNGNKFAEEALKKGAAFSIVDEEEYKTSDRIVLVDDVLETLQQLANYHRKQLDIPIIGLTGSNGKTTTKELINAVICKKYITTATSGNLNNHIGVPLTILSMNRETEIGIVEMGANHIGEIKFLSEIAEPSLGYITNFGKAHLEGFGSVQGVIEGKSELYNFIKNTNNTLIVNPNDPIQIEKSINTNRVLFENTIEFVDANPFVRIKYDDLLIQSNLLGAYNFNNIAAAITIGVYFDVDKKRIKEAIEHYIPTNNRSQIVKKGTNEIVLDAYNANPTSMQAALENFNNYDAARKMIILGDMFELGNDSAHEHQKIAELAEGFSFADILLVGENFNKVQTNSATKFKRFEDLKLYLETNPIIANTTLLIKGSRGMALERCLDYIS
ncbi:UDP-N-acetylmuramoyl-tripeptide--D-alanyl-D-alanine ligase [Tenacibaculum skagerrakense]|uniref:UDP-N-acetylmuramoyl-tripeptide--D-alanyl-D-alanine ligase n=1 Tax=Tenacibaculum skagerrakense TaxID=186571 RepID=A0A4R2NMT6_9FLAO|nr:UDP-N-acetylmuramoyl-tripeptide--D-alanyl-D-alanine ligase [Tenacibaculum skagerrakense]TCP22940.1 UDP-N-acetylmuramoyl-tripeptide--D-alanyl-D-alanine ligase [Tenacibaculum skagerrakense]